MPSEEQPHDVVIVGAGIAGALVAEQLLKDKPDCSILVLEAGTGTGLSAEGYERFVDNYHGALAQVPNSPYPGNPNAPQSNVLDIEKIGTSATNSDGYFVQRGPLPFSSTNTRTAGGTTMHWLGTCLRMLPHDFEMRSRYGHGQDWPIKYDDLMGDYRRAEQAIGVSADKQDQVGPRGVPDLRYAEWYEYPMHRIPQSFVDRSLSERIDGMPWEEEDPDGGERFRRELYVTSTPQGRNSTPNQDYPGPDGEQRPRGFRPTGNPERPHIGERCEGNAACIPICPVMAKYNAIRTLGKLSRDRLEVRVQAVASSIDLDPDSGEVRGVAYKRYASPGQPAYETRVARGRLYVIAASAIESARLMIASNAGRYSSQLGRNLMDHPTLLTWGLFPERIGSYRGPGSTSGIPSLRDGSFRRRRSAFRIEIGNWGWNWATGAPRSTVDDLVGISSGGRPRYGAALRRELYEECQRQFRLAFLVEQTPMSSNRVTVDPEFRDRLGNLRPVLYYDLDDYTRRGLKVAREVSDAIYARAEVQDRTVMDPNQPGYLEVEGTPLVYYGAGHIVGTHRMGERPADSVTDTSMRSWEHRNLFLVGCGSMPTIGTSNPTLTLGALSIRAARAISQQLEGGC